MILRCISEIVGKQIGKRAALGRPIFCALPSTAHLRRRESTPTPGHRLLRWRDMMLICGVALP